jgi:hypothetical protein
MNQIFTKIALLAILFSFSTVAFANNEDPKDPKKVSVVVDQIKPGYLTLSWNGSEITAIQINSTNGQVMPIIPVKDATSLHLKGLIEGEYEISFFFGDIVVATENIWVKK